MLLFQGSNSPGRYGCKCCYSRGLTVRAGMAASAVIPGVKQSGQVWLQVLSLPGCSMSLADELFNWTHQLRPCETFSCDNIHRFEQRYELVSCDKVSCDNRTISCDNIVVIESSVATIKVIVTMTSNCNQFSPVIHCALTSQVSGSREQ